MHSSVYYGDEWRRRLWYCAVFDPVPVQWSCHTVGPFSCSSSSFFTFHFPVFNHSRQLVCGTHRWTLTLIAVHLTTTPYHHYLYPLSVHSGLWFCSDFLCNYRRSVWPTDDSKRARNCILGLWCNAIKSHVYNTFFPNF